MAKNNCQRMDTGCGDCNHGLVDANDLLDAAGIEVTSISCVEVRPETTVLGKPSNLELKHPIRGEVAPLRRSLT
jgi:hypothetical protein